MKLAGLGHVNTEVDGSGGHSVDDCSTQETGGVGRWPLLTDFMSQYVKHIKY